MKMCYITFRSITPAQKAERMLRAAGIGSVIQRTPRWMEEQGCGYCVRIMHKDLPLSANVLREKSINYKKIYLRLDNGVMEAIEL